MNNDNWATGQQVAYVADVALGLQQGKFPRRAGGSTAVLHPHYPILPAI